ncbi:MAG: VTT domain-containing protein [Pseudomonadota bacterium]
MANRFFSVLRQSGGKVFIKGALTIAILVLIGYLANSVDFESSFKALPFSNLENAPWYKGPFGFALLGAAFIAVSCPRQIVSFFAAYFFGLWIGFFTAWAATILGCVITYWLARAFQGYFRDFVKGKLDIALQFWKENAILATVIWRFLPAGSNFLTNIAAGAFGVPASRFISGSAIGYIPQTLIFALVGSGARIESEMQILGSVMLFALSAAMGLWLFARYRKKLNARAQ